MCACASGGVRISASLLVPQLTLSLRCSIRFLFFFLALLRFRCSWPDRWWRRCWQRSAKPSRCQGSFPVDEEVIIHLWLPWSSYHFKWSQILLPLVNGAFIQTLHSVCPPTTKNPSHNTVPDQVQATPCSPRPPSPPFAVNSPPRFRPFYRPLSIVHRTMSPPGILYYESWSS